jgi:hypothetical protein
MSGSKFGRTAVGSMFIGNEKTDHFTSSFSNVWQNTSQLMFTDSHLGSETKRHDREARSLAFHLERAKK